ncbi:ADP-ribose pyrophosphatase YjhB (NUDIX family) [Caldicoprobacter guelmensis]|uniref:NUDIX hydrolase n=1 Tax=Caldicoprobacter guelmensis TaxID=1170224 RepID=UPI0019593469|nr:NUDIX domain-containing protein [Caldicoprobacter guelmensis]MBM7582013.1 ADP-ribose pyrophosphatase YjhB (NUDIX family) [Caldicoprobacter guelmensis]
MTDKMVNAQGLTEEEFLKQYDPDKYATSNPALTVDMLLFALRDDEKSNTAVTSTKHLDVLMIKRGDHPFMGKWALPGGFVTRNEDPEKAALRELKEETGIDEVHMEQLYTWGAPGRDPRTHVVSVSYMALVDGAKVKVRAGDDASDARWFKVNLDVVDKRRDTMPNGYIMEVKYRLDLWNNQQQLYGVVKAIKSVENGIVKSRYKLLEVQDIAFDHAVIITYGLLQLRKKIWFAPLVLGVMPQYFTMAQLKEAYEAVLGEKFTLDEFADEILKTDMIVEVKNDGKVEAGKDKLYMLNPEWDCSNVV